MNWSLNYILCVLLILDIVVNAFIVFNGHK